MMIIGQPVSRHISYNFIRKISHWMDEGFYTKDITTGEDTGFLFDNEFTRLRLGKRLLRTVDESDGNHTFDTRAVRKPDETVYKRVFGFEGAGQIRDISMNSYPFDQGTTIKLWLKYHSKDIVEINIEALD